MGVSSTSALTFSAVISLIGALKDPNSACSNSSLCDPYVYSVSFQGLISLLTECVLEIYENSSLSCYVYSIIFLFVGYHLFNLLFKPLNRVKILGDLGYLPDGTFSLKEIANNVRRRRVVGDIPPVYPNGWFGVVESWQLKRGQSLNIAILGQQLVVFRDDKGVVHILDAYCPHMGANLAVGGRVVNDCIQCPFHGWMFRGYDGKCIAIPYASKVPEIAKVKSWTSVEINGWIFIWHHAEGIEPNWKIPEIEEITSGLFKYSGRTEHHINAHIEEIPENGADAAHLRQVHRPFLAAGRNLVYMWTKYLTWGQHVWDATWCQMPSPEEHVGCMKVTHDLTLFGVSFPSLFRFQINAFQLGPGAVIIRIEGRFFRVVLLHNITPIEPLVQKVVHNIYVHWAVPNILAKAFLFGDAIQVERDVSIWNNKKFQARPVFTKSTEDGLVARHRRWYSQFYSEHSPKLNFQKDTYDW